MSSTSSPSPRSPSYLASATAAVAGAIGVSLCCIGPFVLLALGFTGPHLVEALEPYRPWVVGFELVAYVAYRRLRPPAVCETDAMNDRTKQALFWIALLLIVGSLVALAV